MVESALEIETVEELERFDLGTVMIGHIQYTVLTGYEGTGRCFWCGGELKGKLKRYCRGHMKEYYRHFNWQSASRWAIERSDYQCENCGMKEKTVDWGFSSYRTNLEVHHIVPLKGESRLFSAYNLPWNLIVLCHACHQEVHAAMRPPKLKPEKNILDSWEEARKIGQGILELAIN